MAGAGDFDRRLILVSGLAVAIAVAAGFLAQFLTALIAFSANLAFFGRRPTLGAN